MRVQSSRLGLRCLEDSVRALQHLWLAFARIQQKRPIRAPLGLFISCADYRERTEEILERLYRLQPVKVALVLSDITENCKVTRRPCRLFMVLSFMRRLKLTILNNSRTSL